MKEKIKNTAEILASIAEIPKEPALGLDFDGTIDEALDFFRFLSKSWKGLVYVITYRDNHDKTVKELEELDIKVDGVILVRSFAQKAQFIKKLNIKVYFDDMDEVLLHIPSDVKVFKIRNEGNFSYSSRKWFYSSKTGKQI